MTDHVVNDADALAPGTILGKYQILELIARGGMAEVYKAKSYGVEGFEKILVIKRILPQLAKDREFVELFINEAKISVHLSHTNIVQVIDLEVHDDNYYIAMEYVQGFDLSYVERRLAKRSSPMSVEILAFIISEVAKGLDYAHRRRGPSMEPLGIVHRDISPQNILISYEGEVKITDFGIAGAKDVVEKKDDNRKNKFVRGKFSYMAPEQALGEPLDARADIFSLGVVMYEMACGQNPFRESTSAMTLERILRNEFKPLADVATHVPDELINIIETCLAPDPADRYANAGRLYEELLAFIFTTGHRVSAHTLSQFVNGLRDMSKAKTQQLDEVIAMPGGQTTDVKPEVEAPVEITNVAIPVQKRPSDQPPSRESDSGPDLSIEQHDFAILSIEYGTWIDEHGKDLVRMRQTVEAEGARVLEEGMGHLSALFGLGELRGRYVETAVRCALRIKQLMRNIRKRHGRIIPTGICIKSFRLILNKDGEPVENEVYFRSIVETRDVAGKWTDRITLLGVEEAEVERLFEVEPIGSQGLGHGGFFVTRAKPASMALSPFVNRRREFQELAEQLVLANRGRGRMVGLVGDAGAGKTRFLDEARTRLRAKNDIFWYQITCMPQRQSIPFAAAAQMLRKVTGVQEEDSPDLVAEKIQRLHELGASSEEIDAVGAVLGSSSASDVDADSRARLLTALYFRVARQLSQDRLVIFAWEAARFMDAETETLVDSLITQASRSRLLTLLTYRTGFTPRWIGHSSFREIVVPPLADADCTKVILNILDNPDDVPWEFLSEMTSKSGGNPLFIEETIKALKVSGAISVHNRKVIYNKAAASVGLPKTLKGVVSERLVHLGDEDKGILKVASVVGNRFNVDVVAEVLKMPLFKLSMQLDALENDGIVVRNALSEYSFGHDFMREAVYDSLTHQNRRDLHQRVAQAIETAPQGRPEELYESLAYHYRESGNRKKAVEYLLKGANTLAESAAFEPALFTFLKAIDLLRNAPVPDHKALLETYEEIGNTALKCAKYELGIEKLKLAADLAEEIGNRRQLVAAVTMIGNLATASGKFGEAQRHFTRALELSEGLTDVGVRRDILGALGNLHNKNGEYIQAAGYLEEAIRLSKQTSDRPEELGYTRLLAHAMAAQGKRSIALSYLREAETLAQGTGDKYLETEMWKSRGLVYFLLREWEQALECCEKGLDLAKEHHIPYEMAVNSHNIGDIQIRQGNFKKAFTSLSYSFEVSREHGFTKLEMFNMSLLGYIDAVRFGSAEGIERIRQGIRFAQEKQYIWDLIQGKYFLGLAHFELEQYEEARQALQEAVHMGKTTGNIMYVEDSEQLLRQIDEILSETNPDI
ncbi:MAG: protein kinase [Deltaproteobacteria bacterium]|nr:protein kinase [Deltaproteobacteria bacterium]